MADSGAPPPPRDEDLGEPIGELRDYREQPTPDFFARLAGALRRRSLGASLARLGWSGLGAVFMEFLKIIYSLFDNPPGDGGEET